MAGRRHRRIEAAVKAAESVTGLQFCIYLGPSQEDARAHAEALFVESGLHERPAVLILVAPPQRRVEIVTAPAVRLRLPDEVCADAVTIMTERFRKGAIASGIVAGVELLAKAAGPGAAVSGVPDLPNIVDDSD